MNRFGLLVGVPVALLLVGCGVLGETGGPRMTYENKSASVVVIHLEGASIPMERSVGIGAFGTLIVRNCVGTALVVETEAGAFIGRVEEPACPGMKLTIREDGTLVYGKLGRYSEKDE